ncbi:MAG TPA: peptidylprolyl isomerase [Ignavibacteriaceae bacterium]|nr:peptidylprolyl isomerase [Ignavibacteriaceae bacterium]
MIKYFKYLFAILFIISIELDAQHKDNTIATVGNQKISEREFKLRYELVPHYTRDQFNEDSSKTDLLNSIIAEKLLAQEAIKKGFNNTDYFKYSIQQMKDLLVRDALYKSKIDSKIQISQSDIQKALDRRAKSLYIRIISAYDSTLIFNYFSQLQNNAPFDSIGRISDPVEYDSNKAPLKITYGQMQNDYVEDTLYSLHVGHFSSPVKTNGGWFIFKLVGIGSEVPPNANDPNFNRTITNVIRLRKSRIIGVKYLDNFYKGKVATIDSALFIKLAEKISVVLTDKKRNHDFGRENKLFLDEGNILGILNDFGNNVDNENIVHIEKSPINLKEYLYSLLVYPILINDPSFRSVAYNLMENLNKYIQYKFLSEEGLKEGFQNTPDVAEDLKIWGDDYLAKMLKNKFRDSIHVTDEDVKNYYEKNKGLEKVDILEILNNNLDVIDTVFKELRAGKDFRELARKYTQRSWTKDNGGEFGYFPTSSFGVIGEVASKMKLNHVYGPVRTDSGYSVIKLIGKIIDTTNSENNFESEKSDIKNELLVKEFNKKFFKYIAKLGERTNISINEKELKSLKVLDIPMFTYRYIGFGGRITAMPFLDAWYDWVNYIDKKSNKVP